MNNPALNDLISEISSLKTDDMLTKDFLLSWEQSDDEIAAVLKTAEALRLLRNENISPKIFDSGLAVSIFRDNSTRTRFSYTSAANLLGLTVQDLDEKKSQIAHGETVRETSCMISFLTEAIGIRDDMYIGEGHSYMKEIANALDEDFSEGLLPSRPAMVNLQCDLDHPTQIMADTLHLINHFGGVENLKGKKLVMSWAYSPSYGKPLSVPQGAIGLFSRFGMDVTLAHPPGYNLIPETEKIAEDFCSASGAEFSRTESMSDAFENADIVYPKSWAPYSVMQERTELLKNSDDAGLLELEKHCLAQNSAYTDWECTEELMKKTKNSSALYMHCLPADITGVSCEKGEVEASVFDRYRSITYREASYKPYIIAAMILLAKQKNPSSVLQQFINSGRWRTI
ncbi:MAG: knotted carbamoyltransferase YgeW [Spirochaetales bacterium]|uniref:Knotted carbamoyltransferase YgeW n=1 Tax=Candidatus Thalassospirochaeta sargassi TaxID=3119039 RepID=A0AAJ1IH06_9SPIO|nr:knotted carbamoyltransferase YgeW [Spirochaetales bacterium]